MRPRAFSKATLFLLFIICLPLTAQAKPFLALSQDQSTETLSLTIGEQDPKKVFFLGNPDRLVVDYEEAQVPKISLGNYKGNLVKKVRAGRFDATTIRVVFDLSAKCTLVDKTVEDGVLAITIASSKSAAAKPKPQIPLVIIDPGHGGDDPGAIGPKGSQEKDIVLTFAKALKESLLKSGKYRVMLTRENDQFIPLHERVKIGRKAKGSIFISIHADSAPNDDARGLSVYTLSEKASDAEAAALAERENKVDSLGGIDLSTEREDVADILISLAQRETRNESATLADMLAASLGDQVRLLPNTHRFAGFAVLKAPDIPSVLVETGFISHPAEEKLLKTKEYRQKLIEGIVGGIDRYFAERKGASQ